MGSIHFSDCKSLPLLVSCCEKDSLPSQGRLWDWGQTMAWGTLPTHKVQCSLLQEVKCSCNRAQMVLLGFWGTFFQWDRWGQTNKKAWRASEADTEESAEITASQGAGVSQHHPWDTEGAVQHFSTESWILLHWESVLKTAPSGQKKGMGQFCSQTSYLNFNLF